MKIRLTFKTPDVTDAVKDAVENHCEVHSEYDQGCTACIDYKMEAEHQVVEIRGKLAKFIEYGEYISIEFDTNAGTATVIPR